MTERSSTTRSIRMATPVLIAILILSACAGDDNSAAPNSPPSAQEPDAGQGDPDRVNEPAPANNTTAPDEAASPGDAGSPGEGGTDPSTSDADSSAGTQSQEPTPPPGDPAAITALTVASRATLDQPTSVAWHPDGTGPFVASKLGTIHYIGGSEPVLMLDVSDIVSTNSERGLLTITFDPAGEYLYAHWSNRDGDNVLSAWAWDPQIGDGGATLQTDDRIDLLTIAQPFANHNGGGLAFGPDGFLYWGQGDGGSADDPLGSGQDLTTLLGAILRIDPDPASGSYSIPADNPFVGNGSVAPEIWLSGIRNPWRMAFDGPDLWIADVGQNLFEEINRVGPSDAGADLGWACFEGDEVFTSGACDDREYFAPLLTYGRELGQSVTGGVVYRGAAIPELFGAYIYGDFVAGTVWALPGAASSTRSQTPLSVVLPVEVSGVVSFDIDPAGEIWVTSLVSGQVGRLQAR